MRVSGKLRKLCGPLGAAVVANEPIAPGEAVLSIRGRLCSQASRYTLQLSRDIHIDPRGRLWGFLNHSCDPNCRIDFVKWHIVATRPIATGEQLCFHYLTTEWDMASPFPCNCGADACLGRIAGLRHVRPEQAHSLHALLAPHLRRKLRRAAVRPAVKPV